MKISNRQNELLFYIIDEYIETHLPVGSKTILNKYMKNLSAATIRNEMVILEKAGYLEKVHNSSGRIPSINAYKLYESSIHEDNIDIDLLNKLKSIFLQRNISIDKIIEESTTLISETLNLPLVITEINENELLKGINLIQTDERTAIVILITSTGGVHKNLIEFDDQLELIDLSVCIRIFSDYLIDTKMKELYEKIEELKPIISSKVKNYEKTMRDILVKVFSNHPIFKMNVKGHSELLSQPEFRDFIILKKVIKILEKTTIWQQIAYEQSQLGGTTKVIFGDQFGDENIMIASTSIQMGETTNQISIIGPTRIDYTNVKAILNYIKDGLSQLWKK
ncbi:MAG: heat-inducible transcriptional repressor HrcA [Mycoplasmoidaceae bacterium]